MSDDFFVTFDHLHSIPAGRTSGWCHKGARQLAERYGLNWAQMLRDGGVMASVLLSTGDAMAAQLVEHARLQEGNEAES